MMAETGSMQYPSWVLGIVGGIVADPVGGKYKPQGQSPTDYAKEHNRREDWAESLTAAIYPSYVESGHTLGQDRAHFVQRSLMFGGFSTWKNMQESYP